MTWHEVHVPLMSGARRPPPPAAFCWRREPAVGKPPPPPTSPGRANRNQQGNWLVPSRWELWLAGAGGSRDAPGLGCEDSLAQLSTTCGKERFPPISRRGGSNVRVKSTCAWRNRDSKFLLGGCEGSRLCQAGAPPAAPAWRPRGAAERRQCLQRHPALAVPSAALLMRSGALKRWRRT